MVCVTGSQNFLLSHLCLRPTLGVTAIPWEFCKDDHFTEWLVCTQTGGDRILTICWAILAQCLIVTDKWMDKHLATAYSLPRHVWHLAGKNPIITLMFKCVVFFSGKRNSSQSTRPMSVFIVFGALLWGIHKVISSLLSRLAYCSCRFFYKCFDSMIN